MSLIHALLTELFGNKQADGETIQVNIRMVSPTHCKSVCRFSSAGGDETRVNFSPPLPLEEALLQARKFDERGTFEYK